MAYDPGMYGTQDAGGFAAFERDLRAIPGVLSCGVAAGRVSVLLDPNAGVGSVKRAAAAVAARHGLAAPDLLVPGAARSQRWARLPRAPIAIAGLSAAMLGGLLPLATHSLPPTPPVVLHAAPSETGAPPVVVARGRTGTSPGVVPAPQLLLPPPSPFVQPALFINPPTVTTVTTVVRTIVKPVVVVVQSPAEDEDDVGHVRRPHHIPHTPNPLGKVPQGRAVGWWGK